MGFTPQERSVLRALVDRILPADEYPGAWEAGAEDFLGRLLEGDLASMRETVATGLLALDAEAQARSGVAFASLAPEAQDALLRDLERGAVRAPWPVSPPAFVALLVRTTAEGFYSDAAQGGNRDHVSWRMTGFDRDLE